MKNTSLCYIEQEGCYLLLHRVKKVNDVNKDKWVGIGGRLEENESPEECVLREVWEETGLHLTRWRYCGIVTFVSDLWEGGHRCKRFREKYACSRCLLQGIETGIQRSQRPSRRIHFVGRRFESCQGHRICRPESDRQIIPKQSLSTPIAVCSPLPPLASKEAITPLNSSAG